MNNSQQNQIDKNGNLKNKSYLIIVLSLIFVGTMMMPFIFKDLTDNQFWGKDKGQAKLAQA
ncbi:MAG: hypothetical protein Crog4KO_36030 [Crocinitomicaceae bacterium]